MSLSYMKRILKLLILSIFIFSFACCKSDIRSKYIGDWQFSVEMTKLNIDSIGHFWQDTVLYDGKIINGNCDNEIVIQYTEEYFISLNTDEHGTLYGFPTVYCNGKFENDSEIFLYLRCGGIGGNTTHIINGYKNK